MKISNDISTQVHRFILLFLLTFFTIILYELFTPSDEDHSRHTQMCQQTGEELDCMQYSAWAIGKECSCVVKNRRIKFN